MTITIALRMALKNAVEWSGPPGLSIPPEPYRWRHGSMAELAVMGLAEPVADARGREAYEVTEAGRRAYRDMEEAR